MSLNIDDILRADDTEIEAVPCPEWGGTVFVRTITADMRDRLETEFAGLGDKVGIRAAMVAASLCDEQGTFLCPTPAEVQALGKKSAKPMDRLADAVMRLSKLSDAEIEKLAKNLPPTADDGCG